ncbi:MAG: DUF2851 family protein [Lacibacter sp.]|jgi:hypothetical protein
MNERLLQFIWQHQYFNKDHLLTTTGERVEVLFAGTHNTNQGPDFTNARIRINQIQLAGTVELHLRTSDWQLHGHTNDVHYKNVILHVVWQHDGPANETVLELKSRVAQSLLNRYATLMQQQEQIPCSSFISSVPDLVWLSWKERLIAERIQQKSQHIYQLLEKTNHHWEEVFWRLIARNFGMPHNSDAFEAVAQSVPVTLLAKHKNQIHQLEALLLGQAGLLEQQFTDDYAVLLQKEYQYLKKKHRLQPIHFPLHFLRMRPSNFPTLRLAQLAMLVHESSHLFSKVLEAGSIAQIKKMLNVTANDFWHTHYTLQEPSPFKVKNLGEVMVNNLLINTIIPLLFVYASEHAQPQVQQKALEWLRQLPKENNRITRLWQDTQVPHNNALDSQALLYLKKQYCDVKRCLECAGGNALLKRS